MVLASLPGSRICRLVINDIGPTVPVAAEARIGEKLVDMPKAFKTFDEALAFYRSAFSDYGELDDTCWRHIARHSIQWSETEQTFKPKSRSWPLNSAFELGAPSIPGCVSLVSDAEERARDGL